MRPSERAEDCAAANAVLAALSALVGLPLGGWAFGRHAGDALIVALVLVCAAPFLAWVSHVLLDAAKTLREAGR